MRILQVIDSLRYGGAQKLMVTLAGEAATHDVDVVVACLSDSSAMPLAPLVAQKGAQVVSFPARQLLSPSRLIALRRYIQEGKFSVIHSHLTYANILSALIGSLCGVPVIVTLHSTAQDKRHANFVRDSIELWALKQAALVIAVGQMVQQAYMSLGQKVVVLPNSVEKGFSLTPADRDEMRKSLVGDSSRPILISVGRLSPDKCFDDLLRGFSLLHRQCPNAALVVAGDGVLRDELIKHTNSLGLTDSVFWLGMRNDVPSLLAASDIYVNVSEREGMPVALLEAMAAGLPLVVTPVGDIPYLVRDDAGILVSVHHAEEFANAVFALLTDPSRRRVLGMNARARAEREYGSKKWFENLLHFYQSVSK